MHFEKKSLYIWIHHNIVISMACKTLVHKLLDPWIIEKITEEERKRKQEDKRPRVYIEEPLPDRKDDTVRKRIPYIDPLEKTDDKRLYWIEESFLTSY